MQQQVRSRRAVAAVALAALLGAACASTPQSPASPTATAAPKVAYVGSMALSPTHGPAGTAVVAVGSGLPANSDLSMVWNTVRGSWKVGGTYQESFQGRSFSPVTVPLSTIHTDASGTFRASFTAPRDFGYGHDVTLVQNDVVRNKASFSEDMQLSLSPTSGPPGTPITVTAAGIGWQYMHNGFDLAYDNRFTGWVSSVTTGGTAQFVIPAAGAPGKHVISVLDGPLTFPYLNVQQSPNPDIHPISLQFTVTDGAPVMPLPAVQQALPSKAGAEPTGAHGPTLWIDPATGPVGTPLTIHGLGLPASSTVELKWFRMVGNRVNKGGWDEVSSSLGTVTTAADGSLQLPLKTPDDLGGPHRIEAQVNGQKAAETTFTITPSVAALEPASGPVGTPITVHVKGGGWTETANIYHLVYDNAYLGYACAFNSQGDITVYLPAAGQPGWHFIDLYPGIYKGDDVNGLENMKIPQLTFANDHPGEKLPAFRFAFEVTQ